MKVMLAVILFSSLNCMCFSSCQSYFDHSESERRNALHMGLIYRIKLDRLYKEDTRTISGWDTVHMYEDSVDYYKRIYCSPHCDVEHGFYAYDEVCDTCLMRDSIPKRDSLSPKHTH